MGALCEHAGPAAAPSVDGVNPDVAGAAGFPDQKVCLFAPRHVSKELAARQAWESALFRLEGTIGTGEVTLETDLGRTGILCAARFGLKLPENSRRRYCGPIPDVRRPTTNSTRGRASLPL